MQQKEEMIFDNRYLLKELLGIGGFSEVWLVEDAMVNNKKMALKIYAPGKGLDKDGIQLFQREFELVYDINHTNLLRTTQFSICNRSPYLIMPYCERGSASKLVGKISENEAWRFLRDVASGLAHLHEMEPPIIHQDIKPDNVLIDNFGHYLITDFGISAKARSSLRRSVGEAKSSMTVAYSPPERFGKNNTAIKASDIWSLGATLFELLEGDVPFIDILGGQAQRNGAEIPEITGNWSPELKRIVVKCLQKDTWDRPTAEQLVEWSEKHFKGEPIIFETPSPSLPFCKRNKNKMILVIASIVIIAILSGIFYYWKESEVKSFFVIDTIKESEMVLVQRGTFMMGCTDEQGSDCKDDEMPVHQVTLSSFFIGKYEVTQGLWKSVMGSNPSKHAEGDNYPVEMVNWDDIQEFLRKLNEATGKNYRLPTEAEWEFAARGGNNSKRYNYSGSNNLDDVGWYRDNSGDSTYAVGAKHPNELGIYDMSGNVAEWCNDLKGNYSDEAVSNPKGHLSTSTRVSRGGVYHNLARYCRVSARNGSRSDSRGQAGGFRVVLPR